MTDITPCIKDKCLLLPVCKTKEIIGCDIIGHLLSDLLYFGISGANNNIDKFKYLRRELSKLFPNTNRIYDTKRYGSIFIKGYRDFQYQNTIDQLLKI